MRSLTSRGARGPAMLRLGVWTLLARRARARTPLRHRGATAAGGGEEQERFVFLEYEPDPAERAAAAALRRQREAKPRRERRAAAAVPSLSDPSVPPSGVSCSGCGAEMQCGDSGAPGFVPADKYRSLLSAGPAGLRGAVCQRCWALAHHGSALRLRLPPAEHRRVLSAALRRPPRHGRGPLLLYVLDLTELPDPVLPQLPALLGPGVPASGVLVVGNKVDLLPADCRGHLGRLRQRVAAACALAGLRGDALVDIRLVSAKTGYGIEGLISRLQRSWKCAGDVYLLGATNSGKSTLFNTLLRSDYCKSRAPDIIDRATVSPWPGQGTTRPFVARVMGDVGCAGNSELWASGLLSATPAAGEPVTKGVPAPLSTSVVGSKLQRCAVLQIVTCDE